MPKLTKKTTKAPTKGTTRAPIITIMGHIDHGKTTLLDALRHTHVADKESGGITQHIGAYQIEYQGRPLTFIDTPGHAAFAAMRSRGAKVTDLVILVIDVLDSVKPQTKECLEHIKAANVPFLVALNKIDLPNAAPAIVKKDLADAGVLVEGYGGDVVCCEISAKTQAGLPQLLEMILLLADMQDLKADLKAPLKAVVIESSLDKNRGPVATLIVHQGQLKPGDNLYADNVSGKVKAMFDAAGRSLHQVNPGQPALILGFKHLPVVGAIVTSKVQSKPDSNLASPAPISATKPQAGFAIKIILKADAAGTLEAITQNLGNEVALISQGVGEINESDVLLAQSTGAQIIGFRVATNASAKKLAEIEGILIKTYNLIHELLDDLQAQILKQLEPTIDEDILGEAKIVAEFIVKGSRIAGCQVVSGKLTPGDLVHLIRNKNPIADAKIKSIHQGKDTVDKAKRGEQYGIAFSTPLDFKLKDELIAYKKSA